MTWLGAYRQDIARYRENGRHRSALVLILGNQGLQALLQYRIAHAISRSQLSRRVKNALLVVMVVWQKAVEIITRIAISYHANLGPGLLLGNLGNIFINGDVTMGPTCSIASGVTLGVAGRGACRGSPSLGARVVVGEHAVLAGRITIGDDVTVAPGALVLVSIRAGARVAGNPARALQDAELVEFDRLFMVRSDGPPSTASPAVQESAAGGVLTNAPPPARCAAAARAGSPASDPSEPRTGRRVAT